MKRLFALACLATLGLTSVYVSGQSRGKKTVIDRETELQAPTVLRLGFSAGTLVFERTADSAVLRGAAQSWIALYQPSEKGDFWFLTGF